MADEDRTGAFGGSRRDVPDERKVEQWPQTARAIGEALAEVAEVAAVGEQAFFADDVRGRFARRTAKSALIDLGNAAFFVPDEELSRHDYVPWGDLRRTRDRLAHLYFGTDWGFVWRIVTERVPGFGPRLGAAIEEDYPAAQKES